MMATIPKVVTTPADGSRRLSLTRESAKVIG
jgi:hypothetical protein